MADIQFFGEEFEADYEGDMPWYTVRFQSTYTPSKQSKIDALFMKLPYLAVMWDSRKWCTLHCELDRQELQNWDTARLDVRAQIDQVHAVFPIEAVAFYDEGDLSKREDGSVESTTAGGGAVEACLADAIESPQVSRAFPFYGSGESATVGWCAVEVRFVEALDTTQQLQVLASVPDALAGSEEWAGPHLMVRRPGTAAPKLDPIDFDRDLERWLLAAHEICPICVALRLDHRDPPGPRSPWHMWSVERVGDVVAALESAPDEAARDMLPSLAALLGNDAPAALRVHLWPGEALISALTRGEPSAFRRGVDGASELALEQLAGVVRWQSADHCRLLGAAADVLVGRELPDPLLMALGVGVAGQGEGWALPADFSRVKSMVVASGHEAAMGDCLFRASFQAMDSDLHRAARLAVAAAAFEFPERAKAYANGAVILARCGDMAATMTLAGEGLVHTPSNPFLLDSYLGAAEHLKMADDVPAEMLEVAAGLASSETLLLNVTAVASSSGRYPVGVNAVQTWIERHDALPSAAHLNAAILYLGVGDVVAAAAAAESAEASGDMSASMMMAIVAYHQGDVEASVQQFTQQRQAYEYFDDWADDACVEGPRTEARIDVLFTGSK